MSLRLGVLFQRLNGGDVFPYHGPSANASNSIHIPCPYQKQLEQYTVSSLIVRWDVTAPLQKSPVLLTFMFNATQARLF